mgnify:CR=1 FL=1
MTECKHDALLRCNKCGEIKPTEMAIKEHERNRVLDEVMDNISFSLLRDLAKDLQKQTIYHVNISAHITAFETWISNAQNKLAALRQPQTSALHPQSPLNQRSG